MKSKILTHFFWIFLTTILFSFTVYTYTDDPFVANLKTQVTNFFIYKPWEKLYLHIDKPFYKPGDDIWFKAYLTDGTTNTPAKMDDIVYVELINPNGNIEKTVTLQVIQGICFGNFYIDESASGGIYKIRAYTNWMHNFGKDYVFEKEIQVQKIVYPRLLSKIDFKRESYAPGDTVTADLTLETLDNVPLLFKEVLIDIFIAGSKRDPFSVMTNNMGKAFIRFPLPADLVFNDGLINAKISYEGNTEAISRSIPIVLNKIAMQFFPEGGYMVTNVAGKIAFKATNEFNKPADVEGYIVDESSNRITTFKTFHQGMGVIDLTPLPGRTYYVQITKPMIESKYILPEAMSKGYALHIVKSNNNNYHVTLHSPVNDKIHLVIQTGKEISYSKTLDATIGKNEMEFSADHFPVGTGIVTLFDQSGIPRCERLIFFNYHKSLHVSLKFDKEKYAPREKVTLHIRTLDSDSIPTPANLSLAVVNDQLYTFADDKQHNILSWMLLGSEVKGKIENPSFYFDTNEVDAEPALDNLLLTQGWRRYQWNDVIKMNYNLGFAPEKMGCVIGRIIDKRTGLPVKAEVTMLELQNRKRILKVTTGVNGQFKFMDADASSPLQILARSEEVGITNLEIQITPVNDLSQTLGSLLGNRFNSEIFPGIPDEQKNNKLKTGIISEGNKNNNEIILNEDIKNLEEVVVIGYGTMLKRDITGSIVTVIKSNPLQINPVISIENALQGRVSGLEIMANSGQPGTAEQIKIRGSSSISNNNNPLYDIDGVLFDPNISGFSSPLQNISLNNIESLTVLKDASATAIYGSRGANGVIVIHTSNNWGYFKTLKTNIKPKYIGMVISPRQLSVTKEYYYPVYNQKETQEERTDFRSTVYWNPNVNTNTAGEATVEFYSSDEITSFRAIVEGISANGDIGRSEKKYYTQLPFSMAVKFPSYLTYSDTVLIPLIIKNNTNEPINGKLDFTLPINLRPIRELTSELEISANSTRSLIIPMVVTNISGKGTIKISFANGKYKDAFIQEMEVQPKGFPIKMSISGKEKEQQFSFQIRKPLLGSISASFFAFPDILVDIMSGVESMIHEPHGCFEQTSSSTYPNILALEFLKESGTVNKEIEDKAMKYIDIGYKRLISFETPEHGFEWFGAAPGHEGLTAYGLMEFTDMKKVYPKVDEKMMERTYNWLLSRRDGKGGFNRMKKGYDGFANSGNEVLNAYIVYALSEAGINNVETEYLYALAEAQKSKDPYRLALIAIAASNFVKTNDYKNIMLVLDDIIAKNSWDNISIEPSITRSAGKSLAVETASLYALALLKAPKIDWLLVNNTIKFLLASRSNGYFCSTQGTVLALKALKEYAVNARRTSESGKIEIVVNGITAAKYGYEKGDKGKITLGNLERYVQEGENKVVIRFLDTNSPLPFSFDATWNSHTPTTNKECKVDLQTSLMVKHSKIGETVRMYVKIYNNTVDGLPMTIATVGIPSGLSLQPWQLKEMQEKHRFDFYEVTKNYLVLYYRQMKPDEIKELNFDLRAEIPGIYQAPASSAYLYYTNEYKDWEDGERITIESK